MKYHIVSKHSILDPVNFSLAFFEFIFYMYNDIISRISEVRK